MCPPNSSPARPCGGSGWRQPPGKTFMCSLNILMQLCWLELWQLYFGVCLSVRGGVRVSVAVCRTSVAPQTHFKRTSNAAQLHFKRTSNAPQTLKKLKKNNVEKVSLYMLIYLHIPPYTSIYLYILPNRFIYFHIPPYTWKSWILGKRRST